MDSLTPVPDDGESSSPAGSAAAPAGPAGLGKAPTGIYGLDELTEGGLARGRTTLICGGPGTGKTMLGVEFLVKGALKFDEPGVLLSFEESEQELTANMASLGWDLEALCADGRLALDHVALDPNIQQAGDWDLEGLMIRIRAAVDEVGAKRILLDTMDVMFTTLPDPQILRRELRALFSWLAEQGLTTIVTAEQGDGSLTRYGLEEYVSDCVILVDQRIEDHLATRRLRIVKYRGSHHAVDEFPFLIADDGLSILPTTSLRLEHPAPTERVSTGVSGLDAILHGGGYYRGSSILLGGTPGSGKSTLAAAFAAAACERGERSMIISFEESPDQILRNMKSVGIDLQPYLDSALLGIVCTRPSAYGLETHLTQLRRDIDAFGPTHVVVDPISAFRGPAGDIEQVLSRLLDYLKTRETTALLTSLLPQDRAPGSLGISSIVDTWLLLRNDRSRSGHRRTLEVIKSRGMSHGDEVYTLILTSDGPEVGDPLLDDEGGPP